MRSFSITWLVIAAITSIAGASPLAGMELADNSTSPTMAKRVICGNGGPLLCPYTGGYCAEGTTCCFNICCKAGAACYLDGNCYPDVVYTSCVTTTAYYTATVPSTVYRTITSTYSLSTTNIRTVTVTSRTGVATNTVWVTTTIVAKRGLLPAETGLVKAAPVAEMQMPFAMPTAGPLIDGGSIAGLLLPRILHKRVSTAWITVPYTSTLYRYNYFTSTIYRYATSVIPVQISRTETVYDGASSTITVTSTRTETTQRPPTPPPDPPPSSDPPAPQPTSPQTQPGGSETAIIPVVTTVTVATVQSSGPVDGPSVTLTLTTATTSGTAIVFQVPVTAAPQSQGLSPSATIGIGVGASVGALVLILLAAFAFWRWRQKKQSESDISSSIGVSSIFTAFDNKGPMATAQPTIPVLQPISTQEQPQMYAAPIPPVPAHFQQQGYHPPNGPSPGTHTSWGSAYAAPSSPTSATYSQPASPPPGNLYEAPPTPAQFHAIHEAPQTPAPLHPVYEAPGHYQQPYLPDEGPQGWNNHRSY